ncbi:ABC transporter permease [Streptomyces sp. NPDC055078]
MSVGTETFLSPDATSPEERRPVPGQRRRLPVPRLNLASGIGLPGMLFLLLAFGSTLVALVRISLTDPSPENFVTAFQSGLFRRALVNTVEMSVVVTGLCLLVSYPYAYCLVHSRRLVKILLFTALLLSFWTSLLVRTYSWQIILNDTGLINEALTSMGLIDEPLRLARTKFAVYLGMVHILAPLSVLAIYANMRGLGSGLVLAARGMGARPSVAFLRVTLPLTLPGAVAGATLVLILALGFYITPQMLGGAGDAFIGNAIVIQLDELYRPGVAAAMAVILLLGVLVILGAVGRYVGITRILGIRDEGQS